jgi:hypothetical protein
VSDWWANLSPEKKAEQIEKNRVRNQRHQARELARMIPEERKKIEDRAAHRAWLKTLTPEERKKRLTAQMKASDGRRKARIRAEMAANPIVKIPDEVALAQLRAVVPTVASCTALISAVFNQAMDDLFLSYVEGRAKDREESRRLLLDRNGDWAEHRNQLCGVIDMDGDILRQAVLKRMKLSPPKVVAESARNSTAHGGSTRLKSPDQVAA